MMEVQDIIILVTDCYTAALPFALVFWMGELIVSTILRSAFGGRLSFRIQ